MFMKKCLILLAVALSATMSVQAQTEIRDKQSVIVAVSSEQMGVLTIVNNSGKATRFTVYSLTGQVVKVVELKSGKADISLPRGFYIVRSENGSQKVVVK